VRITGKIVRTTRSAGEEENTGPNRKAVGGGGKNCTGCGQRCSGKHERENQPTKKKISEGHSLQQRGFRLGKLMDRKRR